MKAYLVTVTKSAGIGYARIPTTYAVIADTVYKARRQAARLDAVKRPGLPEMISIHAHAVKPGETVPAICADWAYDIDLCARVGADYAADTRQLAEAAAEHAPAAEAETETTERAGTTDIIARMAEIITAAPARGAWARGVKTYAQELCGSLRAASKPLTGRETIRAALLSGARDWREYSWGGCALVYDGDIAARLCSPSELRRTHGGQRDPNPREAWLDVQARALYQAAAAVLAAYDEIAREGGEGMTTYEYVQTIGRARIAF